MDAKGIMPAAPLTQEFVGTMDVNGDGRPDMVLRNPATGQNEAWLMGGIKRTETVKLPAAPPPWEGMTGYK